MTYRRRKNKKEYILVLVLQCYCMWCTSWSRVKVMNAVQDSSWYYMILWYLVDDQSDMEGNETSEWCNILRSLLSLSQYGIERMEEKAKVSSSLKLRERMTVNIRKDESRHSINGCLSKLMDICIGCCMHYITNRRSKMMPINTIVALSVTEAKLNYMLLWKQYA